jgi:hypothetical protein
VNNGKVVESEETVEEYDDVVGVARSDDALGAEVKAVEFASANGAVIDGAYFAELEGPS